MATTPTPRPNVRVSAFPAQPYVRYAQPVETFERSMIDDPPEQERHGILTGLVLIAGLLIGVTLWVVFLAAIFGR